jgi:hypothetical protein
LLDAFSDRCVRVCRRDPRDSAEAEQALYEQIDYSLDAIRSGHGVVLNVRAAHWIQDLSLKPQDFASNCSTLIKSGVQLVRDLLEANAAGAPPRAIWLTHEAGRLPGLAFALHENMAEQTSVAVLRPEAVAAAIANLGERWPEGAQAHLDRAVSISAVKVPENKAKSPSPTPTKKTVT